MQTELPSQASFRQTAIPGWLRHPTPPPSPTSICHILAKSSYTALLQAILPITFGTEIHMFVYNYCICCILYISCQFEELMWNESAVAVNYTNTLHTVYSICIKHFTGHICKLLLGGILHFNFWEAAQFACRFTNSFCMQRLSTTEGLKCHWMIFSIRSIEEYYWWQTAETEPLVPCCSCICRYHIYPSPEPCTHPVQATAFPDMCLGLSGRLNSSMSFPKNVTCFFQICYDGYTWLALSAETFSNYSRLCVN